MLDDAPACSALLVCLSGPPTAVQQALEAEGFWVNHLVDPAEARDRLSRLQPDLLLLQLDGRPRDWRVCQELAEQAEPPLLVLVADQRVEARLAALACGADDVLPIPYHPLELAGRARALLRRGRPRGGQAGAARALLRHGGLELDVEYHQANLHGCPLALTPLEFRLLRTLLEAPRRAFSRDELLARVHVFDERLSAERSIDLHIAQLRRKLGDSARQPHFVETVRGVGYRLARRTAPSQPNSLDEAS